MLKKPFELISETAQTVMRFTADKLVYIDFNDIIFANLYIGKDTKDSSSNLPFLFYSYSRDPQTAASRS